MGKIPAATLVAGAKAPPLALLCGSPHLDPALHAQRCHLLRGFPEHAPDEDGKEDQAT